MEKSTQQYSLLIIVAMLSGPKLLQSMYTCIQLGFDIH